MWKVPRLVAILGVLCLLDVQVNAQMSLSGIRKALKIVGLNREEETTDGMDQLGGEIGDDIKVRLCLAISQPLRHIAY